MIRNVFAYQDYENSILGIAKCLSPSEAGSCEYDLCDCDWMQIGEVVTLASFFRFARAKKLDVSGRYLPETDLGVYLSRMDFFKVQDIVREEHFSRHDPANRFLPLVLIDSGLNMSEIPAKIRNIVLANTSIDSSLLSALDYAFGEIIDNVLMHSRTPVDGLVGAQYYPLKSFVEFCVADAGVGVPETLRRNPEFTGLSDSDLLEKSFEHGVGENTRGFNDDVQGYGCGFGLTFAKRLVEATGGDLWMVSNTAGIHLREDSIRKIEGYNTVGTVICMRIPCDAHVTENDLFHNGVSDPYDYNPFEGSDSDNSDILW